MPPWSDYDDYGGGDRIDEIEAEYPNLAALEGEWGPSTGPAMLITAMTDKHLLNAARWMVNNGIDDHPKYDELQAELRRRRLR